MENSMKIWPKNWSNARRNDEPKYERIPSGPEDEIETVGIRCLRQEQEAKKKAVKELQDEQRKNYILQQQYNEIIQKCQEETAAKENALKRMKEEEEAKQEALTRLSYHVALKLADNNPNIADLSDTNRPTNLAEKFLSLYDDEWTDAFDALQDKPGFEDESKTIKQLLEFVMVCFDLCREQARTQLMSMLSMNDSSLSLDDVPAEMKKLMKDARKKCATLYLPALYKMMFEKLNIEFKEIIEESTVQTYLKRCTELSWLMAVQDPPMAISINVGDEVTFKKSLFREYTKPGAFVDYIVWPVVLIQDGGALIAKGVAQYRDKITDREVLQDDADIKGKVETQCHYKITDNEVSNKEEAEDFVLMQNDANITTKGEIHYSDKLTDSAIVTKEEVVDAVPIQDDANKMVKKEDQHFDTVNDNEVITKELFKEPMYIIAKQEIEDLSSQHAILGQDNINSLVKDVAHSVEKLPDTEVTTKEENEDTNFTETTHKGNFNNKIDIFTDKQQEQNLIAEGLAQSQDNSEAYVSVESEVQTTLTKVPQCRTDTYHTDLELYSVAGTETETVDGNTEKRVGKYDDEAKLSAQYTTESPDSGIYTKDSPTSETETFTRMETNTHGFSTSDSGNAFDC